MPVSWIQKGMEFVGNSTLDFFGELWGVLIFAKFVASNWIRISCCKMEDTQTSGFMKKDFFKICSLSNLLYSVCSRTDFNAWICNDPSSRNHGSVFPWRYCKGKLEGNDRLGDIPFSTSHCVAPSNYVWSTDYSHFSVLEMTKVHAVCGMITPTWTCMLLAFYLVTVRSGRNWINFIREVWAAPGNSASLKALGCYKVVSKWHPVLGTWNTHPGISFRSRI